MARPYSLDLSERVVAAVESGRPVREVSSIFGVSVSSVVKWSQRYHRTGSAAALAMGGRRPFALAAHRDLVLSRLAEKPDITVRALAAELAGRGIVVSDYAVWHFLKAEGITFKKKPARQRAGPA
jgi:transposase